ncbi:MAG: CotH kinase family protein [Oscillospiraceae bacterium]|nr:CotH kinase family protein [Oscillospiraceae bacterium]
MKKCFILLVSAVLITVGITAKTENRIRVFLDGTELKFEVDPFISESGSTLVPLRSIGEALGAEFEWNEKLRTIEIKKDNTEILMEIDNIVMIKNNDAYELNAAPVIYEDRTFVPVRAIAEAFDAYVEWDPHKRSVLISSKDEITDELIDEWGGKSNVEESTVSFSVESGRYDEPFELELTTNLEGGVIHYTLDGSEPTSDSPVYTAPITVYDRTSDENVIPELRLDPQNEGVYPKKQIVKCTAIRARAINSENKMSKIGVNTYFVGEDASKYDIKVVSITVPESDMFDPEIGVYNFNNSQRYSNEAECSGFIEIFDSGKREIAQPIGIRLNGVSTKRFQQKSMRIYARENFRFDNGNKKNFKYDLFDGQAVDTNGKAIAKYKNFILRNGGNDWMDYMSKDMIVQDFAAALDLDTQAAEPCIVFMNGEFFGYYKLRERYDDHYFESHYNLTDNKDAVVLKISPDPAEVEIVDGEDADAEDFYDKLNFITGNDMAVTENYDQAAQYFDIDNLIDYCILNIYFENYEWPHYNVKLWRNKNSENQIDTRFRFIVSDEDTTMKDLSVIYAGIPEMEHYWTDKSGAGTLDLALSGRYGFFFDMINSLMKNESFKAQFIETYESYLETVLTPEAVEASIDKCFNQILPYMAEQRIRYPKSLSRNNTHELYEWAEARPEKAKAELYKYFGLNN